MCGSSIDVEIVLREADEGGFWAEVPSLPGCATQGDNIDELVENLREAIEAWCEASERNSSVPF
jgi:predicted RNase H-like HicB family nuclease